jgi:hypothetical protein
VIATLPVRLSRATRTLGVELSSSRNRIVEKATFVKSKAVALSWTTLTTARAISM